MLQAPATGDLGQGAVRGAATAHDHHDAVGETLGLLEAVRGDDRGGAPVGDLPDDAVDLAPRVRVNAIAPGPVLPHAGMSEEAFAALTRATPLGRGPSVEEICRALRAILEAPAMTGQLLTLDGGRHLGSLLPGACATPEPMA